VNEFAIACGDESASDLQRGFERGRAVDWAFTPDSLFDGLAIDEFHREEVFFPLAAEMENRSDVAVAELRGGARLRKKTRPTGLVREMARMNHFERDFATQVRIERFVGYPHGAATKLDWRAVVTSDQLILVEALRSGSFIDIVVT
jgi:hypothetical protein